MDQLPTEIIEYIVGNEILTIKDVMNVCLACKHLKTIIESSNYIWKSIYQRQCPHYDEHFTSDDINWLDELKYVFETQRKVKGILETMPARFYAVPDISAADYSEWADLVGERSCSYYIVVDYLTTLICSKKIITSFNVVPLIIPGNRTMRYYSIKSLQFLRHHKLRLLYKDFIGMEEKYRLLEKAAVFVAQWCQPINHVEYKVICKKLDDLAKEVKEELLVRNPNHPIFKVPETMIQKWHTENLPCNQFDGKRCMEIIHALTEVLFKKHSFAGNSSDFYKPDNSYINLVLEHKKGLPITLSIVYESVARRLGLNCEPINMPAHFLLRFQQGERGSPVFFIDAFNEGQLFPRSVCPHARKDPGRVPDYMPRASATSVMLRMAANLEDSVREGTHNTKTDLTQLRSVLELSVLISPTNLNLIVNLSRLCMSLNMDTRFIEEIILNTPYEEPQNADNVLQMLRDYEVHRQNEHFYEQSVPKKRPKNIKYAVGMVMQHKILNYKGVITDWTPVCKASHAWQKSMNVDTLKNKGHQPFYYVIVEDCTHRYVAEENIEITNDMGILNGNEEIGRHFSHFILNHFVPNAEKEREYPDDTLVRQNYFHVVVRDK